MLKLRTTKTASGKTAIQVVERSHQQTKIIKHIGSAGNEEELQLLRRQAEKYILESCATAPLFPDLFGVTRPHLLSELQQVVDRLSFSNTYHTFSYEFLSCFYEHNGFTILRNNLLKDLSIMRIITPASKIRSYQLFNAYFGDTYTRNMLYKGLPKILPLKEAVEAIAASYAKKTFGFDFSLVFYDVTTLYYESFTEDEDTIDEEGNMIEKGLRKNGLGKEIKIGQPIIVVGLMVTNEGFPVSYEVYEGNTFEGDTFIPSILSFKNKHNIQIFTIVADAAMISFDNVEKLKEHKLSYIVGGRMASLKKKEIKHIHEEMIGLNQTAEEFQIIDGKSTRIQTARGLLICDFSMKRYLKDKREMEKQISRAENLIVKNTDGKRTKFLMLKQNGKKISKKRKRKGEEKERAYALNTKLIERTKLLLGIKGYYTNLFEKDEKLTNQDIINHYHNLWHVEKAFRIAKSDLAARPIFLRKRESIKSHILIVFVSLCLAKSIELKTGYSIQKVKDMIWGILDIKFEDTLTGKQFLRRMHTTGNPMVELLEKMKCG